MDRMENPTAGSKKRMALHTKILLSLVIGAVAGILAQSTLGSDHASVQWVVTNLARPAGSIFLNLIFMIVVPLLFSALVLGVSEMGDAAKIGRVGLRALALTVLLSGIAVGIALLAVNTFKPGAGITPAERERLMATYAKPEDAQKRIAQSEQAAKGADAIVELIPKNPLDSAVKALEGGLLPFMVFALIFGIALCMVEAEKALPVTQFLEGLFAVSLKVIELAMKLAPIGVFGLVFSTAATLGVAAFVALGKYALLVLGALLVQQFLVYGAVIRLITKKNPLDFFRQIREVMLTAFVTSSSNATLPTALRVAEENVGLPRRISTFVLTVGATANQNGTALFEGITVIFLAQVFGVNLDLGQQVTVLLLAILAGVGTAGVPGGAWPMIALLLVKVGVPPEAIGLCLGIDRILDMSRTVLNVTGDITIASCVAAWEREPREVPEAAAG